MRGGGFIHGLRQGSRKGGPICGEGGLIGREIVCSPVHLNKYNFQIQWIILQLQKNYI